MQMIFHNTFHFSFILAQLYFNMLLKQLCNHKDRRLLILQLLDAFTWATNKGKEFLCLMTS